MSATETLGARILEAIRSGSAPRPARLAASRGALPLARAEIVYLQALLLADADAEIQAHARAALEALSDEDAAAVATDEGAHPELLAWLAAGVERWPRAGAAIARSGVLEGAAYAPLASCSRPEVLEALAGNQRLLAREPSLARALLDNAALPGEARTRLLDVADELDKIEERRRREQEEREREEGAAEESGEADEGGMAEDPFLRALGIDAELEAILPELGIDVGELSERSVLLGDIEGEDESLIARLAKMKVGQKLKVALFGTREERSLLVRDSNRVVATAVVKNPKFTESEAEAVSNSRNVSDEVLRLIARHRDYSQSYTIRHNLVRNPRCPNEIAQRMVGYLKEQDLKLLLKNRNVGEGVRRQAKKQIEIINQRRRVRSLGKH